MPNTLAGPQIWCALSLARDGWVYSGIPRQTVHPQYLGLPSDDLPSDHGVQPIGADQRDPAVVTSVGEAGRDPCVLLEADALRRAVDDAQVAEGALEDLQQLAAVDGGDRAVPRDRRQRPSVLVREVDERVVAIALDRAQRVLEAEHRDPLPRRAGPTPVPSSRLRLPLMDRDGDTLLEANRRGYAPTIPLR